VVAIELKLGHFKAAHKGQMELYLRWLQRYECLEGEAAPIGLILCAEASREQVELLPLSEDGIQIAEYWTELPSKLALEKHLLQALIDARERMTRKQIYSRLNPRNNPSHAHSESQHPVRTRGSVDRVGRALRESVWFWRQTSAGARSVVCRCR
jgi:hypothetical protein